MGHGTLLLQIVSWLVAWQIVCKAERLARATRDRAEIRALSRRLSSVPQSPAATNARDMSGSNRASMLRYRIGMARLLGLDSMLEFHPAMTSEDLMKAGPGIEQAVKTYVLYILRP